MRAIVVASFVVISGMASAAVVSYYRFEEGSGSAMLDSVGGANGTHNASYSPSVAGPVVPLTGQENTGSLYFDGGSSASVVGEQFILNAGYGSATLEFYLNLPEQTHRSVFWTRIGDSDEDRFNISINPGGAFGGDYRHPGWPLHSIGGALVPVDVWTHFAIVRTSSGGGDVYSYYVNGLFQGSHEDNPADAPDNTDGWSIAGRTNWGMIGYIDELRFSDVALGPAEFLNAPETGAVGLVALAGLATILRRRTQRKGMILESAVEAASSRGCEL